MDSCGDEFEVWAADAITKRWPGAYCNQITVLRGDASFTRRFWRLSIGSDQASSAPQTAILVDLGPDQIPRYVRALHLLPDEPTEPPWINVHRFLSSIGAPVPEIYDAAADQRTMLVEDVGELALLEAARGAGADAADLYRIAVEELLRLHVEGTRQVDDRCIARHLAYDLRLFEWEMKEFTEIGLAAVAPAAKAAAIRGELVKIAARLDSFPRVFSHRDYHGHNLFIQAAHSATQLRIIDFQDALMAPAAQDLAVLLTTRDTGDVITPAIERRLLDFYCAGLARRGAADLGIDDFITSYRLCVLQHALKMIGRFESFARSGKPDYRAYVPHCVRQARRMLAELSAELPQLHAALSA